MRLLKFRVWDNVDWMSSPFTHWDLITGKVKYTSELPVMQFTGLKDKNGTEIYEGDLLDFGNNNPVEVIFDNGAFCVFDDPLGWDFDSEEHIIRTDFKYCEVIGNIHQNPELI